MGVSTTEAAPAAMPAYVSADLSASAAPPATTPDADVSPAIAEEVDEWDFTPEEISDDDDDSELSTQHSELSTDPKGPSPLTVRYNHRDVTVAPEEMADLVQMGLAYRDTRAQLDAQKAELAHHPVLTQVGTLAKSFGLEPEAFLDQLQVSSLTAQLVSQGVERDTAAQRASLHVAQTRANTAPPGLHAAQTRVDRARTDLQKFSATHPEAMQDFSTTLETLAPYIQRGLSLTEAYAAQRGDQLSAQVGLLSEKLAAKETAGKAAAASTGPRSGVGGATPRDPDFAGWEE
jgi:hypothetical protein